MVDENLKKGWIRISKADSQMIDLYCLMDNKGKVVKVFDWDGNEIKLNAEARSVFYNNQYWSY
ncbi:hypothetical protein ACDX34_08370 [Acinetobacter bereziniae]|uniref:hypothetical protein n=1 Tax=Acinetobacter bereziniae TaxID=106648 RepID=UPI0039C4781B